MIEIHLYGLLREIVPGSTASEDTVLLIESQESEEFHQLVHRVGFDISDIGDCFINGNLARQSDKVKAGDRVGLFPFNMRLIDGGMELKYSPHKR
jgi:molybdopterin converting factor small subunit